MEGDLQDLLYFEFITKPEFFWVFIDFFNIKFDENPSSGIRADTWGMTEMMRVTGDGRDYANVPITY
jgi:hypothetical protein